MSKLSLLDLSIEDVSETEGALSIVEPDQSPTWCEPTCGGGGACEHCSDGRCSN